MILITGGTGFIGARVTARLLDEGFPVRLLARDAAAARERFPKAEVADADLVTGKGLEAACRDADTVVHLAGLVSYTLPRQDLFTANVTATENLLAHCKGASRFLLAGSVSVYPERFGWTNEQSPTRPATPYGESKLAQEEAVTRAFPDAVVLRIAPVYGPESPIWKSLLRSLDRGFPLPNTRNKTHVVHADDAAQAFARAVRKGRGPYLIADQQPILFLEFASELVSLLGKRPRTAPVWAVRLLAKLRHVGAGLDTLIMNREYDITKARHGLGYRPAVEWKAGVKEMVAWHRSPLAHGQPDDAGAE